MKELYQFSAHYCQQNGVEYAPRKWEEVKGQMVKTVAFLDSLQGIVTMLQLFCY